MAKNLKGIFDKNNRVHTMGGKTRVEPRSGCRKINKIGRAAAARTLKMGSMDSARVLILDLASMLAQRIKVPILAPSVG
jgi:hypothetical protein